MEGFLRFLPYFCASPFGLIGIFALTLVITPVILSILQFTPEQIDRIPIGVKFLITLLWGISLFSFPDFLVMTMPIGAMLIGIHVVFIGYTKNLDDVKGDDT